MVLVQDINPNFLISYYEKQYDNDEISISQIQFIKDTHISHKYYVVKYQNSF